tara:strand:- start:38 stop:226 length:189 start_codon:yes stop_codon:yes gene_type:complete
MKLVENNTRDSPELWIIDKATQQDTLCDKSNPRLARAHILVSDLVANKASKLFPHFESDATG